jgi:hypothetical protein
VRKWAEFMIREKAPMKKYCLIRILAILLGTAILAGLIQSKKMAQEGGAEKFPAIDQKTPSQAFYFDWISSQYEGSTEEQTMIKLEFFKWLHEEYGMSLDIYSLDVGNLDDGPYTAGVGRLIPNHWGTLESDEFKEQYPHGFDPIYEKAKSFGCRLGIWMGPDGFGDTPDEEKARREALVKLCRDYHFKLFKIDAVAGGLRPEKQDAFIQTIEECHKHCPDLIVANHRVDLGKAAPYATTFLWEGAETYIDVFNSNMQTAPHHRAGAFSRELPPGLNRQMEDHGVCLSSCLDFWEDDLVLQAFNRCLVLAPEIYGNPWLLRDDELPKLARLFNLHRRYRDILVKGKTLPEKDYGPYAVSRGDDSTRFITLRNLTWDPVNYTVWLDDSIGLAAEGEVELRRFHPSERILGRFEPGSVVHVEVLPFRSYLLLATVRPCPEIGIRGCDYEVVRDVESKPAIIKLLGQPGQEARISLAPGGKKFARAELEGQTFPDLIEGREISVRFPGQPLKKGWHRKLEKFRSCPVPADAEALYEATCFAADSNALEVRSLFRSGKTRIPQVERARKAFFEQPMFVNRGIWDKNLFDGDLNTFFIARLEGRALRIDFGEPIRLDRLVIKVRSKYEHDINPALHRFGDDNVAEVSADLVTWISVGHWEGKGTIAIAKMPDDNPVRYVRIKEPPRRIAEVEGYKNGERLDRSKWRASNLFFPYKTNPARSARSSSLVLDEIPEGGYLAVALEGKHGNEGAYVAARIDGKPVGVPDRAVSYPSNTWEYYNEEKDDHYTYMIPLRKDMVDKKIDVVVLLLEGGTDQFIPEAYLTAYPIPLKNKELILYRKK